MGIENGIPSISGNCILEDQGDHLIIALRIPKSVVLSNLDMFGALKKYSESKEPWTVHSSVSPPLKSLNPWRTWRVVGYAICFITATFMMPVISSVADEIIYSFSAF